MRVVPLTGPQADALRQRQLAAIITLLRRATTRPPRRAHPEMTTPAADATIASPRTHRLPENPLDGVSP